MKTLLLAPLYVYGVLRPEELIIYIWEYFSLAILFHNLYCLYYFMVILKHFESLISTIQFETENVIPSVLNFLFKISWLFINMFHIRFRILTLFFAINK